MMTKKILLSLFASLALISCGGSPAATTATYGDPITFDDKQLTFDTSVKGELSGDLAITGAVLKGTPKIAVYSGDPYIEYALMVEVTKKGSGWKEGKYANNVEFNYISEGIKVCDAQGLPLEISISADADKSSFPRKEGEKVWIPCRILFEQKETEAMNKIIPNISKVDLSLEIDMYEDEE